MKNDVISSISYGLYIIGTFADNTLAGCVVNSVFQISSEPKKIAVSLNHNNHTTACIQNTREFTVSVLTEDTPKDIIAKFGFESSRDTVKFGVTEYKTIYNNMPVLTKYSVGWMHCKAENIVDTGTHALIIAEVIDSEVLSSGTPMTYEYYQRVVKGGTPKNAPSFRGGDTKADEYECSLCGYVYKDGDFNDLPDDWVCPLCGATKDKFVKK